MSVVSTDTNPLHGQDYDRHESKDEDRDVSFNFPEADRSDDGTMGLALGRVASTAGESSVASSIVNLTNTIVGGGILALPFAFSTCGFLLGSLFLLVFGGASWFGLHLLSSCALKIGLPGSFRTITTAALPNWAASVDIVVAFKCFGVACSYLVIVGDTLPPLVRLAGGSGWIADRRVSVLLGSSCMLPLCYLKKLDGLKFTSTLSLVFVSFLTCVIIMAAFLPSLGASKDSSTDAVNEDRALVLFTSTTLPSLTVFIFGFTCHQNIIPLANELKNPQQGAIDIVSGASIALAMLVYFSVALAGYAAFGDRVGSDVLTSLSDKAPPVVIARFFVAMLVIFSYPLQCFPSRQCAFTAAAALWPATMGHEDSANNFHWGFTTLFVLCSTAIALAVTDLGVVLSVVGATGSTMVTYVVPGAAYFFLFPHKHLKRTLALGHLCAGLVIMPVALVVIGLKMSTE